MMMHVPFYSLDYVERDLGSSLGESVDAVIKSNWYIRGSRCSAFEEAFAAYCGAKACVGVGNGLDALTLMLKASIQLGRLQQGDEVIVPSHTFIATANSVLFCGGRPVFADITEDNMTIDPDDIRKKITPKTKAIIPVHIYGHPCNMDAIKEIADEKGLYIIEDACQAHGALYKGRKIGSIGDIAAFSFFPSKNMTVCGDGGAVTTGNDEFYEMACALRDQGRKEGEKYHHDYPGLNLRLSEVHAAIGRVQLKHLAEWNRQRRINAAFYSKYFEDSKAVTLTKESENVEAVYHQYVIRVNDRDNLQKYLKDAGISTGIHYPLPVHLQPAMKGLTAPVRLPVTEAAAGKILSIPVHPFLTEDEREYIAEKITHFYEN